MGGWNMRRQFLVASESVGVSSEVSQRLGRWWLYLGSETPVCRGRRVCLIGLAADLVSAEPVAANDLERSYLDGGLEALVSYSDQLVGRFILLAEDDEALWVIPDGWGSLQGFWTHTASDTKVLSSSPGWLGELGLGSPDRADPARQQNEEIARALEYRSVGDVCPISGTNRVKVNHVLNLFDGSAERRVLRHRATTFESVSADLGRAMKGLQAAHGGDTWLPVTAGVDSRWLAWVAAESEVGAKLFTFTPGQDATPDSTIGADIASRLNQEHDTIVLPREVSHAVRADVTAVRGAWRDLSKMCEIEFFSSLDERPLLLNGNGGEILRGGYYGTGPQPSSRALVSALCLGPSPSTFDRGGFNRWVESIDSVPDLRRHDLDELFYWEQRMANWGSDFYSEKENYVDELSPFCSRHILRAAPALADRKSRLRIAEMLNAQPEFNGVPVNPHDERSEFRKLAYVRSLAAAVRGLGRRRSELWRR